MIDRSTAAPRSARCRVACVSISSGCAVLRAVPVPRATAAGPPCIYSRRMDAPVPLGSQSSRCARPWLAANRGELVAWLNRGTWPSVARPISRVACLQLSGLRTRAAMAGAPTITQMCAWLVVSRSGFYEWRDRPASATA
jgi:hypothetical protein